MLALVLVVPDVVKAAAPDEVVDDDTSVVALVVLEGAVAPATDSVEVMTTVFTIGVPLLICDSVMKDVDVTICGGVEDGAVDGGIEVEGVVKTVALVEDASDELGGGVNVEKEVVVSITVEGAVVLEGDEETGSEVIDVELDIAAEETIECQLV